MRCVCVVILLCLAAGHPVPESRAQPVPGETYVETIPGTDVSFVMAYVPGGTFAPGSPATEPGRGADEGPGPVVTVAPFWMGVFEVTHDAYAVFRYRRLDADTTAVTGRVYDVDAVTRPSPPYEDPAHGMGTQGFPAAGMTQWAALQFARWLYEKTGRFYRLPTEVEWEHACRAGAPTAYAFGDDPAALDAYAWYAANSGGGFHPVGLKKPNRWGLYDLHGNVAEWTLDEYAAEAYAAFTDAEAWAVPAHRHPRTVRGGTYEDDAPALRCAARRSSSLRWQRRDPQIPRSRWWNTDAPFVGFRLVHPAHPMTPEDIDTFWKKALAE